MTTPGVRQLTTGRLSSHPGRRMSRTPPRCLVLTACAPQGWDASRDPASRARRSRGAHRLVRQTRRALPPTAAEDLLEIVMRRYERASTLLDPSRRGLGKLRGDTAAVTAMLDRLFHHAHVLTCGPRSWRTRVHSDRNSS